MMRDVNRGQALRLATPSNSLEVFVPQSLYFRLADLSDVTTLFGGSSHAQTSCGISGLTNQCDGYTSVARCFQRQAAFTQRNAPSSFKHDGEQHDSRPSHGNLSST